MLKYRVQVGAEYYVTFLSAPNAAQNEMLYSTSINSTQLTEDVQQIICVATSTRKTESDSAYTVAFPTMVYEYSAESLTPGGVAVTLATKPIAEIQNIYYQTV